MIQYPLELEEKLKDLMPTSMWFRCPECAAQYIRSALSRDNPIHLCPFCREVELWTHRAVFVDPEAHIPIPEHMRQTLARRHLIANKPVDAGHGDIDNIPF